MTEANRPAGQGNRKTGIAVFGYNRAQVLENTLTSLQKQGRLSQVHLWLDGHQGSPNRKRDVDAVRAVAASFPDIQIHAHAGNIGMRKMILHGLYAMIEDHDRIIVLEDDCFPTADCIDQFEKELDALTDDDNVFSVYGHPFGLPNETRDFTRFQGWGWATTADRLAPLLRELLDCYLMSEQQFLAFTKDALTPEVLRRIDVTPGRQPSVTLRQFFAWDETLCLLTALRNLTHRRSAKRIVYNCGAGDGASHFDDIDHYRKPPFCMIAANEVWDVFNT